MAAQQYAICTFVGLRAPLDSKGKPNFYSKDVSVEIIIGGYKERSLEQARNLIKYIVESTKKEMDSKDPQVVKLREAARDVAVKILMKIAIEAINEITSLVDKQHILRI